MVRKPLAAGLKAMLASTGRPSAAATAASTAMRRLGEVEHRLDVEEVHPAGDQRPRLLGEGGAQVASGSAVPMGATIWPQGPMSPATQRPGNSRSRTPAARRAPASLSSTARAESPCASRRMRGAAEGVGVHDVRAGGEEAAVDVLHLGRMRDVPLLRALAGGEAALHERAAQAAVEQQRAFGDEGEQIHGAQSTRRARRLGARPPAASGVGRRP